MDRVLSFPAVARLAAAALIALAISKGVAQSKPSITIQAAGRGKPLFNFQDVRQIAPTFRGRDAAAKALQSGQAEPRVLASGDLDGNATPDVVAGYAYRGTGIVTIQHGNPDAFAPTDQSVYERIGQGYNPDALLPEVEVIEIPQAADFIEVGDFNGDGRKDILDRSASDRAILDECMGRWKMLAIRQAI